MLILIESNNLLLGVVPESLGMFLFGAAMILIAIGLRKILRQDDENFASKQPVNILASDLQKDTETVNACLSVNEK